jgi:hypothetical protein
MGKTHPLPRGGTDLTTSSALLLAAFCIPFLRGDRHPNHACQRNALDLSILSNHYHLTVLNRHPTHRSHESIDERAVACLDY